MSAYVGSSKNLKDLKDLKPLAASRLHWKAGSLRSFTAIRKEAGGFCGTFLRKGEVFACVGLSQNLKDLKAVHDLTNRGEEDRTGQDRSRSGDGECKNPYLKVGN